MNPDSLNGLVRLAALRKETDLALLGATRARLAAAKATLAALDADLANQARAVTVSEDISMPRVLEAHVTFMERTRCMLGDTILQLENQRETLHQQGTRSFGRSEVLERLQLRHEAKRRDRFLDRT